VDDIDVPPEPAVLEALPAAPPEPPGWFGFVLLLSGGSSSEQAVAARARTMLDASGAK
jgi:hypothetical protein